ncbi:MAG: hypothetical protein Q8O99_00310 [bacterium]|nr:hypothetical protein [bacterium]
MTKAEKQVNKAVANVSQKIEKKVTPEFRQKATKFASQADKFAGEVEAVGEELEQIAEHILPSGAGSSAMFVASYDKNVSRLFIFRCLWLIIQ